MTSCVLWYVIELDDKVMLLFHRQFSYYLFYSPCKLKILHSWPEASLCPESKPWQNCTSRSMFHVVPSFLSLLIPSFTLDKKKIKKCKREMSVMKRSDKLQYGITHIDIHPNALYNNKWLALWFSQLWLIALTPLCHFFIN